jgi:hypothetical protein
MLMIENVLKLQEVTRSEVVVAEHEIAPPEFLPTALFAIHVAMQ